MYEHYAKIRDSKGLKDSDVSKATGISQGTLSDWKKGRYKLKYEKLQKIAELLEVSTDQLAGKEPASYYLNEESAQIAQEIFENPELRALFHTVRDVRPEDLKMVADLAERLKRTNPDG